MPRLERTVRGGHLTQYGISYRLRLNMQLRGRLISAEKRKKRRLTEEVIEILMSHEDVTEVFKAAHDDVDGGIRLRVNTKSREFVGAASITPKSTIAKSITVKANSAPIKSAS